MIADAFDCHAGCCGRPVGNFILAAKEKPFDYRYSG